MNNSSKFFSNTNCEYFPCRKTDNPENFSCMFCYCPLYHMAECPDTPEILPNGIKDCTNCIFPHYNYDAVIDALRKEVIA